MRLIRTRFSEKIPVILCADSGFADQKAFACFENDLFIHYIVTNKLYNDIKAYIHDLSLDGYSQFTKNKAMWKFIEFGNRLKSWTRFLHLYLHDIEAALFGKPSFKILAVNVIRDQALFFTPS